MKRKIITYRQKSKRQVLLYIHGNLNKDNQVTKSWDIIVILPPQVGAWRSVMPNLLRNWWNMSRPKALEKMSASWWLARTWPVEMTLAGVFHVRDDNQFRYDLYARETMGCHQCGGLLGYCTVVPCL
jgi:hypothetical protein